jgi:lysophospholipase L1-like esterase
VLEDRCLLSADPTLPSLSDANPGVILYQSIMLELPKGDPAVVFLGDSFSFNFAYGEGAPVWAALAGPLNAANYGVAGQTTQNLLFQLALGQLDGLHPSVIVLDIGANNLRLGDTPQAAAAGIVACVEALHAIQPQAQILLIAVPPGGPTATDPYRIEAIQTDALVAQVLAGDPRTTWADVTSAFVQPDGTIPTYLMSDYLHPTVLGYLGLTEALLVPLMRAYVPALASSPAAPAPAPLSVVSSPV